jgi:Holliday junction resolvase-like predicted endonuclease
MPIFSRLVFYAAQFSARRGLREDGPAPAQSQATPAQEKFEQKEKARRSGMRGETFAYWYLRRHGYSFVAKNYMPHGVKGELDLVGYDGKTLAFVEVRTRTIRDDISAIPELSVNTAKQSVLIGTAQRWPSAIRRPGHRQCARPPAEGASAQRRLQSAAPPLKWPSPRPLAVP